LSETSAPTGDRDDDTGGSSNVLVPANGRHEPYARIDYSHGSPNIAHKRPYLVLDLQGPSGDEVRLHGLLDTGADCTVFPWALHSVLGYTSSTLEATSIQELTGSTEVFCSPKPTEAWLPSAPEDKFDITPFFAKNCETVLWGRRDFFKRFNCLIFESDEYVLVGPFTQRV
jgi:hypothetical protein